MTTFKVAKTGGSVDDSVKDLAFDSSQNYMIILAEYDITTDVDGNYEITHNLGYIPSFYLFIETSSGVWTRPDEPFYVTGSNADSSKIYISGMGEYTNVHVVLWANSYNNAVGDTNNNVSGKLKIAKSGYSADTALDLRQFVFASGKGFIIIKEKKQFSITINATYDSELDLYMWNQSATYAHGLNYVPQVQVFQSDGSQLPYGFVLSGGTGSGSETFIIDNTNLTIHLSGATEDDQSGIVKTFNSHIFFNKIE